MSPAERANARISVEFESSDDEDVALGRQVERLWNGGQCDEALAQLGNLEARIGTGRVAIGNSWRTPVPTVETDFWGSDVRIGNRDSLVEVAFDMDTKDSSLFVALRHGSRPPHYSVCMSTDSGATWAETFTWVGSPPTYLDVAALRNHFYVLYNSPGENVHQVRLRRFLCSDGSAATFSTGAMWVAACTLDVGDTMREASLVSSRYINLYITALVSDGSVLFSVDDADGVSWVRRSTGITSSASNGLDATINQDSYSWFFFSYYDTNDTLRIHGIRGSGGFEQLFSLVAGRGTPTSISAYRDTVICAFEDETSSPHQVRYAINYRDGDTWRTGTLSNADTAAESPAVAVRGGRLAAVFRHYTSSRELRFRQCTDSGPWSDPVSIAANEPYWNRPAIEDLGAGVFGVVYLSDTSPVVRGAYFDRSDWPYGLAEQRRLMMDMNIFNVTPNPLTGHGRLNYTLNRPADLRVQVYDRAGCIVRTLFHGHSPAGRQSLTFDATGMAPGVYFVRADADGRALTVPMTFVK